MRRSVLGAAAVIAAFAATAAPAAAKTGKATAPLLKGNETCGQNNGGKVIGKATVYAFEEGTPSENLGLSVIYNAIAVPVAILGVATPLIAAIAMSGSSVLVTLNAMRGRAAKGTCP